MRKTIAVLVSVGAILSGALASDLPPLLSAQAQPAQEEFVPIDDLPPEDQLPAAPLLVAAYIFVWLAIFAYLWSIWRRLLKVERELTDLSRRAATE